MGKKRRPEFKIEPWGTRSDSWYLWKKDKRATRTGGWRLIEVDAMIDDIVKALSGRR